MSLETATFVDSLVTSNPDGADQRSTADDHLRLIKACLKRTFPLIAGGVSASHVAIGYVNDLSASVQAQLNELRNGPATANFALTANSASFAVQAGFAQSASFAAHAAQANSASFAVLASFASSAAAATVALFANSASYAALAGDATSLGGTAAAGYAQLAVAQSFSAGQAITQANTSGTSLTPNCAATTMFRHTLTGNLTIANPTSPRSGMVITFHLIQDATGSRTVSWGSAFKFNGGTPPSISTAANAVDVIAFQYDSTSAVWRQAGIGVS